MSGACRGSSIHRSAWKKNSRKFTVAINHSDAAESTRQQHGGTPSASKRSDLVAVVAPFCIKELRHVTVQLPEKSGPIFAVAIEVPGGKARPRRLLLKSWCGSGGKPCRCRNGVRRSVRASGGHRRGGTVCRLPPRWA